MHLHVSTFRVMNDTLQKLEILTVLTLRSMIDARYKSEVSQTDVTANQFTCFLTNVLLTNLEKLSHRVEDLTHFRLYFRFRV